MDRIDRDTLYYQICNAIGMAPKPMKKALKDAGTLNGPGTLEPVVERVLNVVDSDRRAVIKLKPDPGNAWQKID